MKETNAAPKITRAAVEQIAAIERRPVLEVLTALQGAAAKLPDGEVTLEALTAIKSEILAARELAPRVEFSPDFTFTEEERAAIVRAFEAKSGLVSKPAPEDYGRFDLPLASGPHLYWHGYGEQFKPRWQWFQTAGGTSAAEWRVAAAD